MESSSKVEQYRPPTTKLAFNSKKRYDVFLSFRGPDVRKTLVDHLYEALSAAGLNVFLDSEKLEKGEMIELSLERAMEGSAIRIPIFSKRYAESVWCLKEAAEMLRTPGLIIPLFYYVDPTHVRYPLNDSSPYKPSFDKHYSHSDRHLTENVDKWKDALRQICEFSGWSMDLTQGFEARLVKKVVNDLIKTLDKVSLEVAKHPVGIDNIKNALIQELHLNSANEVVKLGIWGIGGIGKTTIAKALYNQIYARFEAASFVSNVRATAANPTGLTILQNQILEESTKYVGTVYSVEKGISLLRERLGGKRVLLIVDDVDAYEQLNALVGDWLGSGSRVIITSRDQHIVNLAQVQYIHEMNGLEKNESLELFSWHTFLRKHPSPGYEDLSKGIVKACKGHPLSLEVIGSFLYDKKDYTGCWTEALSNIALNPDIQKRVYNTLKISYDSLSNEEKEIFLDIACFLIGENKTRPIVFWKSMYKMVHTSIFNLLMKSLIKIDDKGLFDMHDHLRDMGRTIAETEKKVTRLWKATHLSTSNFSRIRLNSSSPQRFEMLCSPGLQHLHLQDLSVEGTIEDTIAMIPPSLIWLRLNNCTFASGMDTAVTQPRHSSSVGNIGQLKIMELEGCSHLDDNSIRSLFSLPNIQLQFLRLRNCGRLNIPPANIGDLSQLQHLDLSGCEGLNVLPDSIGNLSQLQHLDLSWSSELNVLPDSIGNLSQLQHLDLTYCPRLNVLPDSIGNLSQLQHLDLICCFGLNVLPDSIGKLSQLQRLYLSECYLLNVLPDSIGKLSQLQRLYLNECYLLNVLPDSIGNLSQLQHLDLSECRGLNVLPDSIGNLSQLQHLDLSCCEGLNVLPDSIGNLSRLRYLDLRKCRIDRPRKIGNLSDENSTGVYGLPGKES